MSGAFAVLPRAVLRAALPLLGGAAVLLAGCGSGTKATPAGKQLQREYLVAVAHQLAASQPEVDAEVAATMAAWPYVLHGLPPHPGILAQTAIAKAARVSESLKLPALFEEKRAESITGPGNPIANDFRVFDKLSRIGWQMIQYAVEQLRTGTPAAARFAAATSPLYIDSVYDAHFGLAQIGKNLLKGYEQLEGPEEFHGTLTQAEVNRLALLYSETRYRLNPRPTVKLGS